MSSLPSGTVTFLFTDIEGSTKLWELHREAMARALARHDVLMRQTIGAHGGHVFKAMGDAFCAVFPKAKSAVECALQAQRVLGTEPWGEVGRIKVRMALHTGEAEERDGDYFGSPLNRSARLLSAGYGQQVLLSQATASLVRDALPDRASLKDLGLHRLRDLVHPEQILQLFHPDLPGEFPPLRGLESFPNNLPVQKTSFVGREKEMEEVKNLVRSTRLLTLTAIGGCGKTRLALQVGADLLEEFPDGAWLVAFAALTDPALVVQEVATAVGVREEPGRLLLQTLLEWLRSKRLLLLLDNCEHLIDASAQLVDAILASCVNVKLVVTSREPLGIPGEGIWRVPSLSVPEQPGAQTQQNILQYEAARLFIDRVMANSRLALTDESASAIAQICRRLDGIPLAIELAAARVRVLSVEELASRLDDRFRLLTGGSRTALPRQQTLRAMIDWSYDLLTETERILFRRLSVFPGEFSLEAVESICSDREERGSTQQETGEAIDVAPLAVLDLLTRLIDKSLVLTDAQAGRSRYRMLETVRQYGADRLLETSKLMLLRDRHLEFFSCLAKEAEPHLTGADQEVWLKRLDTEHDNLRAGLEYSCAETVHGGQGLWLAGALWWFWYVRGYLVEGRGWLERVLAMNVDGPAEFRAKALNGAGALANRQADYMAARLFYEQSMALYRELGDRRHVAYSLNNIGLLALEQSNYSAARELFEETLAILRDLGEDKHAIANLLNNLGMVAREQCDFASANKLFEESLSIRVDLGDQRGIAMSLYNMGLQARSQGDYATATRLLEEGLLIQRTLGDKPDVAWSINYLGDVAWAEGDFSAARSLYLQSLEIFKDVGEKLGHAFSLNGLGELARVQGEFASARSLYKESLEILQALGDKAGVAWVQCRLGHVARELGEVGLSRTYCMECLELRRGSANQDGFAEVLECFGLLAITEHKGARAAKLLGAAAVIREQLGAPLPSCERATNERKLAKARAELGEQAFAAAWTEGRAMTTEQVLDYVREQSD